MELYTPIEEAGELIRKRWADKSLREAVESKLGGDIPEILKDGPSGLIWRQICTPDNEFKRFLDLTHKINLKPLSFEYTQDKFYAGNFTKYGLANLAFFNYLNKNKVTFVKREQIIDFKNAETQKLCDLKTLWGEDLVDFHHFFLQTVFPEMKNRVFDISEWSKRNGGAPKNYYSSILSFAICHSVYFDDFDLLESESDFTNEIVLPAFNMVKDYFKVKPIVVKISDIGEHDKDPFWWCYSKESKVVMDNHIKQFTC